VIADRTRGPGLRCALGAAVVGALALSVPASAAVPSRVSRELRPAVAPTGQLDRADQVTLPGGAVVHRFQQRVGGRPVLGAEAVVNDAPGVSPRLIADSTRPLIDAPGSARIDRTRAIRIASADVGVRGLRAAITAGLVIRPGEGGTLVWRVVIPSARPLGDFEVLVDAATGEIVARHDLLDRFQTGKAKLYKVNPVVQRGGAKDLWGDHHDRDTPLLRRLRRRITLPNIDDGQDCLRGRWVHSLRGRKRKETCKRNLRWDNVTRSDGRFEALMVYFEINRAQAYIQSLGFSDSNPSPNGIADRAQRAIADAFKPDNSFYSSTTRLIAYGSGGVDDAEDGDVIVHEYGHAMQDSQSPGFGQSSRFQAGALAEGSSDYWAAAISAITPHTSNEDDVCIFDWDATTYGKFFPRVPPAISGRRCGRRADFGRTLPAAKHSMCRTDIHCVGQVWSSALWDLRRTMVARHPATGGPRMDQIYLASQFLYVSGERFKHAAQALMCADENLHPRGRPGDCEGEDYPLINREMRSRGILQ
jgi:Fungalysin metallopeptidase (M36)/Fungalysin/Thermolysin Propeptide Motif